MVMLAEHYDFVIGGDPDRDTIDLAVLATRTGDVCAHLVDRADAAGYRRLLDWAQLHAPGRRVWALEGTGSFAAGLATVLAEADEDVVEITGGRRSRGAKSDRIDTVAAARRALASEQQASPRARGLREALRQILVTRQAVLVSRTKAINELKSLIVVAPEHVRAGLEGVSLVRQLERVEALTSAPGAGVEHRVTVLTLRSIAARIRFLLAQTAELDPELLALVKQHPAGPVLLDEPGVGPVVAAQLLISCTNPADPVSILSRPRTCPCSSMTATSWWASAQSMPQVMLNASPRARGVSAVQDEPEGTCGDLMEALEARRLTSRSRSRRLAGPPSTSRPRRPRASWEWPPASGSYALCTRSWAGEISGAPASHPWATRGFPGSPIT